MLLRVLLVLVLLWVHLHHSRRRLLLRVELVRLRRSLLCELLELLRVSLRCESVRRPHHAWRRPLSELRRLVWVREQTALLRLLLLLRLRHLRVRLRMLQQRRAGGRLVLRRLLRSLHNGWSRVVSWSITFCFSVEISSALVSLLARRRLRRSAARTTHTAPARSPRCSSLLPTADPATTVTRAAIVTDRSP